MKPVDRGREEDGSHETRRALGARTAVGLGAFSALCSLFFDHSVHVAALRGALVLGAVGLVWRLGTLAMERARSTAFEPAEGDEGGEVDGAELA